MSRLFKPHAILFGITAAALSGGAGLVQGDVLNVSDVKDATIVGAQPSPPEVPPVASDYTDTNKASGAGPAIFAGADGSMNITRSLIQFNVSAIPSDATITSVTVTLYLAQVAGTAGNSTTSTNAIDRQFGLYAVNQSWSEGTTSGAATAAGANGSGQGTLEQNGDSTWDYADYNSNSALAVKWNNGTSNLHGANFSSESGNMDVAIGAQLAINAPFTFSSSAGLVADVQSWVDGSSTNNGWLLKSDNLEFTKQSFLGFWTKDSLALNAASGAQSPLVTINYTLPAPEPAGALLLAPAVCLYLRRRR